MKGGLLNEFDVIEVTLTGPSNSRLNITEFINRQIDLEKLREQVKRMDINTKYLSPSYTQEELLEKIWGIDPDRLRNIIEMLKKDGYLDSHFFGALQQRRSKPFNNSENDDQEENLNI
jgi:hypothetical protein